MTRKTMAGLLERGFKRLSEGFSLISFNPDYKSPEESLLEDQIGFAMDGPYPPSEHANKQKIRKKNDR